MKKYIIELDTDNPETISKIMKSIIKNQITIISKGILKINELEVENE